MICQPNVMQKCNSTKGFPITHVLRNGNLSANPLMDSLTYFYKPGTNQLDYIRDRNNGSTAHSNNYGASVDIKDQSAANYSYDAAGNLQYDRFSGVDSVTWNVYGKMQRLYKKAISALSSATLLHNYYDPSGEKVGKATIYGSNTSASNIYTWYVRDARGNVMAVYQTSGSNIASTPLILLERYMYGSSRLGSISENRDMSADHLAADNSNANLGTAYLTTFTRGKKFFEVSNHLGTVMTILNDRRTPQTSGGVVTGYSAVMQFAADYTPFGMEMLGRAYGSSSSPTYRYKFNGKERIYEVNGRYHQYDYGMRIYDAMFDRFWTVDPITSKYPMLTPYQFASNSPISGVDLDGLEYLGSNEARIEVVRGIVKLKIANMHNVTRNYLEALQSDTKNWSGTIGLDTRIGSITMGSTQQQLTNPATPNELNEDPTHNPLEIPIERRIAQSTNLPDRRIKEKPPVESASPMAIRRLDRTSAVLDAVIIGSQIASAKLGQHDFDLVNQHSLLLQQATDDVNFALKNSNLIPRGLQTEEGLSEITNVVLSGVSSLNNKKAVEVGMEIYNTFSKRRQMYDGFTEITGPSGQVIMKTPKLNPIYDPNYAKEAAKR
jgi:RHS repeat-associated protein